MDLTSLLIIINSSLMGGCVNSDKQVSLIKLEHPYLKPPPVPAKESAADEVPRDIVAELPIIHPEQSHMSSSNYS